MSGKKVTQKSSKWVFTLNNYTLEDLNHLKSIKDDETKLTYLCFQEETAPETGTKHLQGFIHLKTHKIMTFVKKLLNNDKIHLEVQKGSNLQNLDYCTKSKTRTGETIQSLKGLNLDKIDRGQRTDIKNGQEKLKKEIQSGMEWKELVDKNTDYFMKYNKSFRDLYALFRPNDENDVMKKEELFPWEIELLDIFRKTAEHRTIHWIWSQESGTGKTIFKQYCENLISILDVNNFKLTDIIHGFDRTHKLIWANISRIDKINDDKLHVLEKLSDGGNIQSTKYEGEKKFIKSHIVCTSNHPPPFDELPKRIREYNIDDPGKNVEIISHALSRSQQKLNDKKEFVNCKNSIEIDQKISDLDLLEIDQK